jgi:hypothetical protein
VSPDPAAAEDPENGWDLRVTYPQRALPPSPLGDDGFGTVPGYEFEGRRPPGHQASWTRGDYRGSGDPALRRPAVTTYPALPGPAGPEHPGVTPRDADGEPRRFRYTQTVSQPPADPPPAWRQDDLVMPGFEFDGRAQRVQASGPDPFSAGYFGADALRAYRSGTGPFAADPWGDDGTGFAAPRTTPARPATVRPATARPTTARPGLARPVLGAAGAEWARLLRSFLPEPAKRSWFSEFRSALRFRGLTLRVLVPTLAMIVFGVSVVVIAGANSGSSGPAPAPNTLGFPPATLAGREFTAADTGRGISQVLGRVTSDGAQVVAVGSQAGARIPRAQFYVSPNDGRSWAMGSVRAPDGGPPPPGHAARLVAGGAGAWVAIGPDSVWTSTDGRTWTLSSATGLPLRPGDQISVLKRTSAGFIAAGANMPGTDQAKARPVVFLSADGIGWRRLDDAQLHLAAGTGRALDIRYAAAYRNRVLIAGDVAATVVTGKPRRAVTIRTSAAWLSTDGGTTWTLAVPPAVTSAAASAAATPAGHGGPAQITGLAATGDGFILVSSAMVGSRPAVHVYRSPNGTAWTFQATLGTRAGFTTGLVDGGPGGAVVTGQAGRALTAFASPDGASWRQTLAFGSTASESVSGVTVAGDGVIVAAGTTSNDPDSRQPLITVLGTRGAPGQIDVARIPGADDPQLAVDDLAAGDGRQVAVGSADGYPAAWVSANGGSSWTPAVGQTQAVLGRPGIQQLTSVTYGAAGWLAVGGVTALAAQHPVVIGSADGSSWQAADGEAAFAGPGVVTEQAAAGPGGYVIVGYQVISGHTIAAAWWSAGLTGWRRAGDAAPGALDRGNQPGAGRQMLAVTAGPHGFVAVGSAGDQASAWTSPDGRNWTQESLPLPVGATRAVLQHVATNGRTVAAAGMALTTTGQQLPFAASSSDGGAVWTESVLPVPSGRASVTALAAAGGEFIATGTFGRTAGHQDVVVWTSAGGSAWRAVTPVGQGLTGPGIQAITGLATSASTLTGVGFTASPAGEQPVFWQSPIR